MPGTNGSTCRSTQGEFAIVEDGSLLKAALQKDETVSLQKTGTNEEVDEHVRVRCLQPSVYTQY